MHLGKVLGGWLGDWLDKGKAFGLIGMRRIPAPQRSTAEVHCNTAKQLHDADTCAPVKRLTYSIMLAAGGSQHLWHLQQQTDTQQHVYTRLFCLGCIMPVRQGQAWGSGEDTIKLALLGTNHRFYELPSSASKGPAEGGTPQAGLLLGLLSVE